MKNLQNARILHDCCRKKYQNIQIFIFPRKINEIPEFYMIFARKMPKFYIIIARKIFFSELFFLGGRGGHVPPAPHLLHLWGCNYKHQPNERFHGRDIFRETGRPPWKTHSSVKSPKIPRFSMNFYQVSFIYEDFVTQPTASNRRRHLIIRL